MSRRQAFQITEDKLNKTTTKMYEGIFAQGSGYLHIRGSYEEGLLAAKQDEEYMRLPANVTVEKSRHPRSKCGTYIPGITGLHPLLKEEIVNLPNPLVIRIYADGEALDMDCGRISEYFRELNLRNGILYRTFKWTTLSGACLECSYSRYISKASENLLVQEVTVAAAEKDTGLEIVCDIDMQVKTNGYDHFQEAAKNCSGSRIEAYIKTDGQDEVWMVSEVRGMEWKQENDALWGRKLLKEKESVRLRKLTAVNTSRDTKKGGFSNLREQLMESMNNAELLEKDHLREWNRMWNCCEVEIDGDDKAQRAVNFSLYHLLRCARETDSRTAICAKGFSGEAYFGHYFWDTEIYLLPFYLYSLPQTAKNLMEFRLNTLDGAKQNARAMGYTGAKYPWESSVTGLEQCPNWQYADHEIHINADVVFGIWNYYCTTGDEEFLLRAVPAMTETARYWMDRVIRKRDGSYELHGVMGPDEYICFCNNNAYTNYMVRYVLEKTVEAVKLLELRQPEQYWEMGIDESWRQKALDIGKNLIIREREDGLIWQCDGFENYEEPCFDRWWRDRKRAFGACVSQERNYRVKALKQADVLMLPYLFPRSFSKERTELNYQYYIPYTTHDSSLSSIVHSIILGRLDRKQEAFGYFEQAMNIDLEEEKAGAAEGVHIANCGGIWQAVVLGFAGMTNGYEGGEWEFHPRLPEHWKRLAFKMIRNGVLYRVVIEPEHIEIERDCDESGK